MTPKKILQDHKRLICYFKQQLHWQQKQLRDAIKALIADSTHHRLHDSDTEPDYRMLLKSRNFVQKLVSFCKLAVESIMYSLCSGQASLEVIPAS